MSKAPADMTLDELVQLRETRRRTVRNTFSLAAQAADFAHEKAMGEADLVYDTAMEAIEDELRPLIDAAEKVGE